MSYLYVLFKFYHNIFPVVFVTYYRSHWYYICDRGRTSGITIFVPNLFWYTFLHNVIQLNTCVKMHFSHIFIMNAGWDNTLWDSIFLGNFIGNFKDFLFVSIAIFYFWDYNLNYSPFCPSKCSHILSFCTLSNYALYFFLLIVFNCMYVHTCMS